MAARKKSKKKTQAKSEAKPKKKRSKARPAGITPKKKATRKKTARKKGKVAPPTKPRGSQVGKRKGKAGRPEFTPTAEQRGQVSAMAGFGIKQVEIAACIVNPETGNGISTATLHEHFKPQLVGAKARKIAKVADNLFNIATDREGGGPAVTAAIFFLKARAGWSEKIELTHTTDHGVLVVPGAMTPEQWVAEQQRLNGERQPPEQAVEQTADALGSIVNR